MGITTLEDTKLLAAIVAHSNDAILSIDLTGKIISWNKGAQKILGYKEKEILGKSVQLILPKYDKTKSLEVIDKIKKGDSVKNFETVRIHKDGSPINVNISSFPLRGDNNKITGVSAIIRDISEKKKTELRQSVAFNIAKEAQRGRIRDIKTLAKAVHTEVCNVIDARNFYIALYNEKDHSYQFPYHVDEFEHNVTYKSGELDGSLTDCVRRTGKPLLINEAKHDGLISRGELKMVGASSKVWLGVPLKGAGKTLGVMAIQSYDNGNAYTKKDLKFLQFVSREISGVLERALVIEEMFRSGEYYRAISEKATDITTIHNKEGKITYASQSVKPILGYKPTELIGKNIHDYIHPNDIPSIKEKLRKGNDAQGRINLFEFRIRHKNKSWRYIESTGRDLTNNHIIEGIVVNSRDVSKRKKTQEALKQSEIRYKTVVRQSFTAIYMLDPVTKKILEANKTFLSYLGYSKSELNNISLYDFVAHDKKNIDAYIRKILKDGKSDIGERYWRKKNGQILNVLVSASKIKQDSKDIVVVTARDITKQKQVENELKTRNKELDAFVYKASHDLRSPLASTLGLINLGRNEVMDEQALVILDLIHQSMYKLDGILEDLTQVTIVKQGALEMKPIKATPLIHDIIHSFEAYPQFEKIDFQTKNKLKKPIIGDIRLLKTILRNIVENAVKYSKPNSKRSYIVIKAESNGSNVIISVADNGMGIPKKYQKDIYDMFFRATEVSKGSGLGLYIVKNAVDKLGGSIELTSKEKKGTTFKIYLPKP